MKLRVLIVDDEPLARDVIRHWLADKAGVEIVAECGNGIDALACLRRQAVDLVYLDVQMPEMDGFMLLQQARDIRIPAVVFVTAYDKYALRAFEAHALDYLLKPFDKERFDRSFERARRALEQDRAGEFQKRLCALVGAMGAPGSLPAAASAGGYPARLTVRHDGRIVLVRPADLLWIEAEGDYVRLHTSDHRYLIHEPLGRLAAQLDPGLFVRIHRSAIVNVEHIREMEPHANGEYQVVMQNGVRLKASRTHRERLLAALGRTLG